MGALKVATEQMAAVPVARAALWEDFIDIFFAPASVFARRAASSVWPPMLVVAVLFGALFYMNSGVLQPVFDGDFNRGIAAAVRANPRLTPEMVERLRTFGQQFALIGGVLFMPIATLCTGTALWLIGKLLAARQTYRAALVVTAYSYVPKILEAVLNGLQGLLLDPAQLNGRFRLTLGAGRFFDPDVTSPMLLAVIGRIDVFTIWVTVLLAIGLAVTGGVPRARAFAAAPLIWLVGALPLIVQAMRQ